MGKTFTKDSEFSWRRKRVYIPSSEFQGYLHGGGATDGSAGTNGVINLEAAASGLAAPDMTDAGDMHHHLMMLPYDFDRHQKMEVAVIWSTGSVTSADSASWIVTYTAQELDVTVLVTAVTALNDPITLLDIVGGSVANVLFRTAYGRIDPDSFTYLHEYVHWRVELDAESGIGEELQFWGLELRYTPKFLVGPDGMGRDAQVFGEVLSNNPVVTRIPV